MALPMRTSDGVAHGKETVHEDQRGADEAGRCGLSPGRGGDASAYPDRNPVTLNTAIAVRRFVQDDAPRVRELFIAVNRLLSPAEMRDAFEAYIDRALREEIDRIEAYYAERNGGFWVATRRGELVGTFGLERASAHAMELRRMYVDPAARRRGIARQMLSFAEDECRRRGFSALELSTSELQVAALALYRGRGYELLREETAQSASNKTVGSGIRRFYFTKSL